MIARHEGQILLVAGAIPGERVTARIERVEKRLAFASTTSVVEASPDRRDAQDPLCGGCVYAHIAYPRQVRLKADIIADAFIRIGRLPLSQLVSVRPSPETAYRLRARLHVHEHAAGFYREGTHTLCDARLTNQLSSAAIDAVDAALAALGEARSAVTSLNSPRTSVPTSGIAFRRYARSAVHRVFTRSGGGCRQAQGLHRAWSARPARTG